VRVARARLPPAEAANERANRNPAKRAGEGSADLTARTSALATVLAAALASGADDVRAAATKFCRCGPFLADPARQVLEWKLAKDGRGHVHSRIDQAELPVRHLTRRTGSPYTLMLTKTQELFGREREARERDQADLAWLGAEWPLAH
jgi:hypothetical protein